MNKKRSRSIRIFILPVIIIINLAVVSLLHGSTHNTFNFAALSNSGPITSKDLSAEQKDRVREAYSALPLYFVENKGQLSGDIKYYAKSPGHSAYFTRTGVIFEMEGGVKATLNPVGIREGLDLTASAPGTGKVNYALGNDPRKWIQGIPTFGSVTYTNVYPGVDLSFYGTNGQMEYDVIIRPGADAALAKFEYSGLTNLSISKEGDLVAEVAGGGVITHKKPSAYQEVDGRKVPVEGSFKILKNGDGRYCYGFRLGPYDSANTLVIDPGITYSSYLGGTYGEAVYAMAADAEGNFYVAGFTLSSDYPVTPNAAQAGFAGDHDCFVTRIDASGALGYSTYLGGSGYDTVFAITIDGSGNMYLGGATGSSDFPVTQNGTPKSNSTGWDGFAAKIDPTGALVYSTCIGGTNGNQVSAIAVDNSGNAYVGGATLSADFPTKNPLPGQGNLHLGDCAVYNSCIDGFVAKIGPSGALNYSTYLGGSGDDEVTAIAADATGNVYVAGITNSSDFPTKNPLPGQAAMHPGDCGSVPCYDGFISKIDSSGNMAFSTFLGGSSQDTIASVAVDSSGNIYVAGNTGSSDFPTTPGAFATNPGSQNTGFITKIDSSGTFLTYSTFLGGTVGEQISGMSVDSSGNVYVAGNTYSPDFPTTPNAIPMVPWSYWAGFVTRLNASGSALVYSTLLGWNNDDDDMVTAMTTDTTGNIYVAGGTFSSDFPITPNATYPVHNADQSGILHQAGFITRISPIGALTVTIAPQAAIDAGAHWSVDGGAWQGSGATVSGLSAGQHSVLFNGVSGWTTPGSQTVTVKDSQTTSTTGTYVQQTGSLTVSISPQNAITAGAQWSVDGSPWLNSGAASSNLSPGMHSVAFSTISGWNAPTGQSASVSAGQTTSLGGTYVQQTGSLSVTINSPAVAAGAAWCLDGGSWQISGSTVTGIAVGQHSVTFKNIAGWVKAADQNVQISSSQAASVSGQYQQLPAVSGFQIANGAQSTSSRNVSLNNSATGNPNLYMASESSDFSGGSWLAYSAAPGFTLSAGGGLKTIYFKVKNSAGESTPVSDTIIFTAPPAVESFVIDGGAATTAGSAVELDTVVSDQSSQYLASESSTFAGAVWKAYSSTASFTLSAGNGTKTVYFKIKNSAGVSTTVKASITMAQLPAITSFRINSGAASTKSNSVTLNNTATGWPTQYMASESPSFSGATWLPYSTAAKFTLSPGGGKKTIYFQLRNNAGESSVTGSTIQTIVKP